MKKIFFLFLFTFLFAQKTDNSFRLSFQDLKFNNEHLGLLETSYFFNFNKPYLGISIYSAITGKRGGFFTGGITAGFQYLIYKIILDNGIFIGGGGGGSAPQGSGLMIKIYSGILYSYKHYNFGFNINHIKFKDGSIDSTQLAFLIDYKFNDIYFTSIPKHLSGKYGIEKISFSPFITEYFPIHSKTTNNKTQKEFLVTGAEISKDYKNYFTFLSAGGAFKGDSDGYAEYFFGIGKKFRYLTLKGAIGGAGGGKVNTKGGFVYKIETKTNFNLVNASLGFMNAPGGIKAFYAKASINKKFNFLTTGNKLLKFKLKKFNFSLYSESYLPSTTIRKNNNSKRLDVLNIDVGEYINKNFILFVNAASAYNGESGGYAVGMFGGKFLHKNFFIKTSIGAAGGGSVDIGGGMIVKAEAGITYKNYFLSVGRIKAIQGNLNTTTISIGLNFNFYKGVI